MSRNNPNEGECQMKECRLPASVLALAKPVISAILHRDELDREHSTLADDDRRGARAHPMGAHPAAGRIVHGFRAGTC